MRETRTGQAVKSTVLAAALVLAACPVSRAVDVWFEDSNLGGSGGIVGDFVEKFHQPESFDEASQYIDVYLIRGNVLSQMDDQFFTDLLFPYLQEHGIALALNVGGATRTQAGERGGRVVQREMELFRRIKQLGGEVGFVSLQSALSKPVKRNGKKVDYSVDKRLEDVVSYAKAVREIFPNAQIGLIDALPSHGKDYEDSYRAVADALAREGVSLAYIHLDMPMELVMRRGRLSWADVREVERFVEEGLGASFGLFTTSRKGGNTSSSMFRRRVMTAMECYLGFAGGTPDDLILASWFRYPDKTIPEDATGDDYPAMRIVLEYGRRVDDLERIAATGTDAAACTPSGG
jgi:hypothetical protein